MNPSSHRMTKQHALWGTYGKGGAVHCGGTCPLHRLQWVRLVDCTTEHLQAILRTQSQIRNTAYPGLIASILRDRDVVPESFNPEAAREFERQAYHSKIY
jgi:hypothetical protein